MPFVKAVVIFAVQNIRKVRHKVVDFEKLSSKMKKGVHNQICTPLKLLVDLPRLELGLPARTYRIQYKIKIRESFGTGGF